MGRRQLLRVGLGAGALLGMLACGGGSDSSSGDPTPIAPGPPASCEEGDTIVEGSCQPLVPSVACAPGTRAALGSASCVPVGNTVCAPGFAAHPSGWGCLPVVASAACAGATREALGSASCAPVGDCSAAFPPAGATIVVDASLPDEQVDATHFKSLRAAVETAPAQAVIAVAAGTYAEGLVVGKRVTIVGRCAEQVVLDAPSTAPAVEVRTGADLELRDITVRGGRGGVDVASPAHASLSAVVLDRNLRAGITASGKSAVVEVSRSVIRGTRTVSASETTNGVFVDVGAKVTLEESAVTGAADAGLGATGKGVITLLRSVVRDPVKRGDGVGGSGARAFEGGVVSLEESAVIGATGSGVIAGRTKGGVKLLRSTVSGTRADLRFGAGWATAASILDSATLDATDTTFADNAYNALSISKPSTRATLTGCVVVGTTSGGDFGMALGASVLNGAVLQAKSSAFIGSTGMAISAIHAGSTVTLESSLVSDVRISTGGPTFSAGHGGTAVAAIDAAHVTVTSSTLEGAHEMAMGALDPGTELVVDRTLVSGTGPNGGNLFGHALVAKKGARVTLRRSVFEKGTGIGLAFAGATALVQHSFVRGNAVGIHVQEGSTFAQGPEAPETVDALTVFVTDDTSFDGNETRVGSGEIPLPAVLAPEAPAGGP